MSCGNPATETEALMPRRVKYDKTKFCVKCKNTLGNIVIRHAVYCKGCFHALMTFRFRRCLGPSINPTPDGPRRVALKASGNLLLAFSGGLGSTILLDLVWRNYFKSDTGDRRMPGGRDHPRNGEIWKKVAVCYVEICSAFPEMRDRTDEVRTVVEGYDRFEFIPLRIEDAFDSSWWEKTGGRPLGLDLGVNITNEELVLSSISTTSEDVNPVARLRSFMTSLPTRTAIPTTVQTLIRLLLLHTAHSTASSHLLFGTSLTSLSIGLISSISQGGGFVVREETQEEWNKSEERGTQERSDNRRIRISRPLREIGTKECAVWAFWTGLRVVGKERVPEAKQSISGLTKDFIIGLERDFPSTVSTIASTCGKLAPKEGTEGKSNCVLCERPVQRGVQEWKRRISIRSFESRDIVSREEAPLSHLQRGTTRSPQSLLSLAPHLCYACHTTFTSRSSRGTTQSAKVAPAPGTQSTAVVVPVWVRSRLNGINVPEDECRNGNVTADDHDGSEAIFQRRMGVFEMKNVVADFLLDDT